MLLPKCGAMRIDLFLYSLLEGPLLAQSGRIFHTRPYVVMSKIIIYTTLISKQFLNTLRKSNKYSKPRYIWHFNVMPLQLKVPELPSGVQLSRTCSNCTYLTVSTLSTRKPPSIMFPFWKQG